MLMPNSAKLTPTAQTKTHKFRTFFASIAGIIAIYLILSSITVVWLNRTLTDTSVYVDTVAPLVQKPAIQTYIAQKVTNELVTNAPTNSLASALLPASEINTVQSTTQLQALLKPVLQSTVLQIVQSPSFLELWRNTNRTADAALVAQLNSNSSQLQLDLSPAINGIINELKASKLSSIANQITINTNSAKIDIKGVGVNKAHRFYKLFQEGTIAIVVAAILMMGLSVWLSVQHGKTARRILMGTGILALLEALILKAPDYIKLGGSDQVTQAAIRAFAEAILRNLELASLVIGVVCIAAALSSKAYVRYHH